MTTRINVEEVIGECVRRRQINDLKLSDIEWLKDGKPVEVPAAEVEQYMLTGLTNTLFCCRVVVGGERWAEDVEPRPSGEVPA